MPKGDAFQEKNIWRRRLRDLASPKPLLRRIAFLIEAIEQSVFRLSCRAKTEALRNLKPALSVEEVVAVAAISHWRRIDPRRKWNDSKILLETVRNLVALSVAELHIVILTNDAAATRILLEQAMRRSDDPLGGARLAQESWEKSVGIPGVHIAVIEPRLRWPYRRGVYLTWKHKRVLRRAVANKSITHFLYLEDDVALSNENVSYWLAARSALAQHGLVPGFAIYEQLEDEKFLVSPTKKRANSQICESIYIEGIGSAALHLSHFPYQPMYIMDRTLMVEHITCSSQRSPLRSRVSGWGIAPRAAAGTIFGPSQKPMKSSIWLGSAPFLPPVRHVLPMVPNEGGGGEAKRLHDAALIQHLRPTYAANPESPYAKVLVSEF